MTTPPSPSSDLERLRALGFTPEDLARVTGVRNRTAVAWLRGARMPRADHEERLASLAEIANHAARVVKQDAVALWLRSPIPAFDGQVALDLIARRQDQHVHTMIRALEEGVFT
jgi:transcriptional regulator with XRE-family HTH domain